MSEALKNQLNHEKVEKLSQLLAQSIKKFDQCEFVQQVFTEQWSEKSLKQRVRHISICLNQAFKNSGCCDKFADQVAVLSKVEGHFEGLFHFIFQDYIGCYGINHFQQSMLALAQFTQNSTAEFAIREFIGSDAERCKSQLVKWSHSDNPHLRRLASEAVRPRLPWAKQLPWIGENPQWVLPIIDNLLDDPSRYVQKSVANLLNDLSKTEPLWVLKKAQYWLETAAEPSEARLWIIKHALRSLLKQGNSEALAILQLKPPTHIECQGFQISPTVQLGENLIWQFDLIAKPANQLGQLAQPLGKLRVEYAIYFLRASLPPFRKVFKIADLQSDQLHKPFCCKHRFKPMTTRKLYSGEHRFELIVNGQVMQQSAFVLQSLD